MTSTEIPRRVPRTAPTPRSRVIEGFVAPRFRDVASRESAGPRKVEAAATWKAAVALCKPQLLTAAVIGAVSAYLMALLLKGPAIFSTLYWYPDVPEGPYLGNALIHAASGGQLFLPTQTAALTLGMDGVVAGLPFHRALWVAIGPLCAVLMLLAMWRAAALATGRRPALLGAAFTLSVPPVVLWQLVFPDAHVSTFLCTAVLAWYAVDLARSARRPRSQLLITIATGVFSGVCVASDPQMWPAAIIPLLATFILVVILARDHEAARYLAHGVVLVAITVVVTLAMLQGLHSLNATLINPLPLPTCDPQGVRGAVDAASSTFVAMFTGSWYSWPSAWTYVFPLVAGVGGAIIVIRECVRVSRSGSRNDARAIYAIYWACSAVALFGALLFSGYGGSTLNGHYVNGVYLSFAAMVPLLASWRRWGRATAVVITVAVAVRGAVGLLAMPAHLFPGPAYADLPRLTQALQSHHLTRGYAGYWDSHGVTWNTDDRVTVLPVATCGAPWNPLLCRYTYSTTAWYHPTKSETFLVTHRDCYFAPTLCVEAAPPMLGDPKETFDVGRLKVYVYSYDLATKLQL